MRLSSEGRCIDSVRRLRDGRPTVRLRGIGTAGRRRARRFIALSLVAFLASVLFPLTAFGSSANESVLLDQETRDRLAGEFSAVLSLREASDSMCLLVVLNDESIFESQSRAALLPASLMKVVTATAALEVIRPDEVYSTEVFARADAMESITGGVLRGDLYLIGQGDPVLSTSGYANRYGVPVAHTDITKLADRVFATLAARGVRRIEGGLVGDESWFPEKQRDYTGEFLSEGADPVWKRSFVTSNNAGPLSALLLNGGFSSYSPTLTSEGRRRSVRAANPAQHAASVFDDLLEARGMVITQRPLAGVAPALSERTMLGAVESPPLSEILTRMLSYSDNTIAEMLLKEIGRRTGGSDRATAAASVQTLLRQKLGPLADGLVIADGSGLSYSNRLTCAAVAELLVLAGPGSPLVEGLSVSGERGTLRSCVPVRSRGGEKKLNTVRAKTGQLDDATALAGTTVAANGETLTFAMIANKPGIIVLGTCNRLRRTVLSAAANYTYGPAPSGAPAHAGDRAALVALFESTGGDTWFNTWGWKTEAPLSQWHGLSTDSAGRVTEIDLSGPFGNGLMGSVPEEIGQLSELIRFDLSGNDLSGGLPYGISDLTNLTELQVSGTGLCVPRAPGSSGSPFDNLPIAGVGICPLFVDTLGNTHAAALEALAERGVLDDTECAVSSICPNAGIKRWTVAVWLVRALDSQDPPAVNQTSFHDVETEAWWMPYVERLAALQITKGCATQPRRYCPDDSVTRAQMASFLVRSFDIHPAASAGFSDTADNTHEAHIDALAAAGITIGCSTEPLRYCPTQPVTRGQMATLLTRALRIE